MKSKQAVHEFPKLSIKNNVKTTIDLTTLCSITGLNKPMDWSLYQDNYYDKSIKKV